MQNSKGRLIITKLSLEDIRVYIDKIFKLYNCENNLEFLNDKEIFMFTSHFSTIQIIPRTNKLDEIINALNAIGLNPYSIGEPIILVLKDGNVKPLLPFSRYLIKLCKNKIYLPDKLAEILTYGKSITLREPIEEGAYIVMDKNNNFIAYCTAKREKNKTKIIPELDIGWYLREGG
mgnify:CR=1 FL=1